jgi:3-oxoacyl-[acyl-carrier protein] reductase
MSHMSIHMEIEFKMNFDFSNQNILVTGGTRGIGEQISNDFLKAGANVIVTGTSQESLSRLSDDFTKVCVNFLDPKSIEQFTNYISSLNIDVCINNAGINKIDPVCNIDEKDWNEIIQINLTAPFHILKTVAKNMKKQKYGRVINISSIWGTIGKEKRVSYSSSKFGLVGLTKSSAAELAQYNILVNSVSPGFTLTDLTKMILSEEEMLRIIKTIPIRRMAKPSEISKVVMFMSSKHNSYISGQNIVVDGGFVNV